MVVVSKAMKYNSSDAWRNNPDDAISGVIIAGYGAFSV
jgi:hypothetical protein